MKNILTLVLLFISASSLALLPDKLEFSKPTVEIGLYRTTYQHLSDDLYAQKLKLSLEDPHMFFRSFVNTYYQDLSKNTKLGTMGLCLGDAHAENFGFIEFSNTVAYVFNDLDDASYCPLATDALRYFTALNLMGISKNKIEMLINYYQKIAKNEITLPKIDPNLIPDLQEKRRKNLKKYSSQNKLIIKEPLLALNSSEKIRLLNALANQMPNWEILDIAFMLNEDGGSGGLPRYWILAVDENEQMDLIELKALAKPGSSFGPWSQGRFSLASLKKELWPNLKSNLYFEVTLDNTPYLVRSRAKSSVSLKKLSDLELDKVLQIQTSIMAQIHRKQWNEAGSDELAEWLKTHYLMMGARYLKTYNQF